MKNILLISKVIDICTPYIGYSNIDAYFQNIKNITTTVGKILDVSDIDISDSVSYLRSLFNVSSISELKLSNIELVEKKYYESLTKLDNLVTIYDEETFNFDLNEKKLNGDKLAIRLSIYLALSSSIDISNDIKLIKRSNYQIDSLLDKTLDSFNINNKDNKRMGF